MVDFLRTSFQVSIRRACRAVPACRATYHYRPVRADQAVLRKRIREIAETRGGSVWEQIKCEQTLLRNENITGARSTHDGIDKYAGAHERATG